MVLFFMFDPLIMCSNDGSQSVKCTATFLNDLKVFSVDDTVKKKKLPNHSKCWNKGKCIVKS